MKKQNLKVLDVVVVVAAAAAVAVPALSVEAFSGTASSSVPPSRWPSATFRQCGTDRADIFGTCGGS